MQDTPNKASQELETEKKREFSFLIGSWDSDPEVEKALEDQRKIDLELWS